MSKITREDEERSRRAYLDSHKDYLFGEECYNSDAEWKAAYKRNEERIKREREEDEKDRRLHPENYDWYGHI